MAGAVEVIERFLRQGRAAVGAVRVLGAVGSAAGRADLALLQCLRPEAIFQQHHPAQGFSGPQVIVCHLVASSFPSVPPTCNLAPQTGQKQASGSRRRTPQWWQNEGYSLSHGAQSRHRPALTLNMAE